eukprot:scaffold266433_cov35-Tisochrysis_lutea.AAC.5
MGRVGRPAHRMHHPRPVGCYFRLRAHYPLPVGCHLRKAYRLQRLPKRAQNEPPHRHIVKQRRRCVHVGERRLVPTKREGTEPRNAPSSRCVLIHPPIRRDEQECGEFFHLQA